MEFRGNPAPMVLRLRLQRRDGLVAFEDTLNKLLRTLRRSDIAVVGGDGHRATLVLGSDVHCVVVARYLPLAGIFDAVKASGTCKGRELLTKQTNDEGEQQSDAQCTMVHVSSKKQL